MSKSNIVYWASHDSEIHNWNILYDDMKSLYNTLKEKKDKESSKTFFECPAFIDKTKNIFVLNNPIHSKFSIENKKVSPLSKSHIHSEIFHEDGIINNNILHYGLTLYFFAEEELEMSLSSPFFQKAEYLNYGSIIPGKFNIGSWFRKIDIEINLWEQTKIIEIKEEEPLAYFQFETHKPVKFQRFTMNENLYKIANTCGDSGKWYSKVPLAKRYKKFNDSGTKKLVLSEIKKNIF